MIGEVYIDETKIGIADFQIIDESMGVIGGQFIPDEDYKIYKSAIRLKCVKKGIANVDDFGFRIRFKDNLEINTEGGIGVTDIEGVDEINIEAAGIDISLII